MRVFLLNSRVLSEINRKEEITQDTYLVTDREADLIKANLESGGHFWVDENGSLRLSGKRPNEYVTWDEQRKEWVVDRSKYDSYLRLKRAEKWEEIKAQRESVLQSGVKMVISGSPKWFHTDIVSQQSYDRAKDYLKTHPGEKINWKTMDNTFVEISLSDLEALTDHIFLTGQRVFEIAEEKRLRLEKIEDITQVESFDIKGGWVEVFSQFRG